METTANKNIAKLKNLIGDVEIAILSTLDGEEIISRPMATSEVDDEGNIWFFTNEYSGKVGDVINEPKVNVSYSHPGRHTYVTINGYASVVHDRAKMEQLFNPTIKIFFPQGLNDPKLTLLKVRPYQAEYWENHSVDGMLRFMGILGSSPIADEELHHGEHGKISL